MAIRWRVRLCCFEDEFKKNSDRRSASTMKTRIMYIECKSGGLTGPARIGRVTFSKTGRTLYYQEKTFKSLKGAGSKANYYEEGSGNYYWISGPRRDGTDRLYGESTPVEIDADVREEYWREIRNEPERVCEAKSKES
jgi:hypothetical protein